MRNSEFQMENKSNYSLDNIKQRKKFQKKKLLSSSKTSFKYFDYTNKNLIDNYPKKLVIDNFKNFSPINDLKINKLNSNNFKTNTKLNIIPNLEDVNFKQLEKNFPIKINQISNSNDSFVSESCIEENLESKINTNRYSPDIQLKRKTQKTESPKRKKTQLSSNNIIKENKITDSDSLKELDINLNLSKYKLEPKNKINSKDNLIKIKEFVNPTIIENKINSSIISKKNYYQDRNTIDKLKNNKNISLQNNDDISIDFNKKLQITKTIDLEIPHEKPNIKMEFQENYDTTLYEILKNFNNEPKECKFKLA